jgi:hypothetical protein
MTLFRTLETVRVCWNLCLCVIRTEQRERKTATREEQFLLQILC